VLPFTVTIRPGRSIHDQLVFAVRKAVVTGQLQPGDRFPSVRALSQELKVNPNTAMKVVASLVEDGLLDVQPGIGTIVAARRAARAGSSAIQELIERLVVDAKRLELPLSDVIASIRAEWKSGGS
jgi:GntR family transcriptional regulator